MDQIIYPVIKNYHISRCLARTTPLCQCKRRIKNNRLCGLHLKCKNIFTVDKPITQKDISHIKFSKKTKLITLDHYKLGNYKFFTNSNIIYSKNLLKLPQNLSLFDYYFNLERNHVMDKTIKIQGIIRGFLVRNKNKLRGPCFLNRKLSNNTEDILDLQNVAEIEPQNFFSYKDKDGNFYSFKISSINEMLKHSKNNPYNQNEIPTNIINNIKKLTINNVEKKAKQPLNIYNETVKIFQMIDELNNYTQIHWFLDLDIDKLKKLYYELFDIWVYRASLTQEQKLRIIPKNNVFKYSTSQIYKMTDKKFIQHRLLREFRKFITQAVNKDDRVLGSMWILTALTCVSQDAANALPWLVQ